MAKILDLDIVRVVAGSQLSCDDIQVLTLLYQPLIGSDGFALYMTLYNLIDRQKMTTERMMIKEIIDILNIKNGQYDTLRKKIEAVGLLRVLKGKEDYIYFLNLPLSAKNFMSGDLGPFLYSQLGDVLFRNIYKKFSIEKVERSEYIEVTHSFDDVFESNNAQIKNDNLLLEKKRGIIKINNCSFDMDMFLSSVKGIIDRRKATDRFRQAILRIAYTYGFDFQEMSNICHSSFNGSQIDMTVLSKKARELYQNKNKAVTPVMILKTETDEILDDGVKLLVSTNPKEILESESGMGANVSELNNINIIWDKTEWDIGVINAFLLYILKKKGGTLPSLNYLDKVAQEWKRRGINDVNKAKSFLDNNEDITSDTIVKEKRKSEEGNWIDEWYKKIGEMKDE